MSSMYMDWCFLQSPWRCGAKSDLLQCKYKERWSTCTFVSRLYNLMTRFVTSHSQQAIVQARVGLSKPIQLTKYQLNICLWKFVTLDTWCTACYQLSYYSPPQFFPCKCVISLHKWRHQACWWSKQPWRSCGDLWQCYLGHGMWSLVGSSWCKCGMWTTWI